jgi:N-sulfoglucosamine sulfohydrolase
MVRFPAGYQHLAPAGAGRGAVTDRLVSFVDFAPSILSLLGLPIPQHMQGEPFLGPSAARPRQYVFGARDRVDEAFDLARSVRDRRWLYIRNYMPHLSWAQPEAFSDQSEFRRELVRLAAEGKLNQVQMLRAGPARPAEELYDTAADPHQVRNLADDRRHHSTLKRMRAAHHQWELATRDIAFMPESEIAARTADRTAYELRGDPEQYPLERLLSGASSIGLDICQAPEMLADSNSAMRYLGAIGIRAMGASCPVSAEDLAGRLDDGSASVRIEVAGALCITEAESAPRALAVLTAALTGPDLHAAVHAARTLQLLGEKARPALPAMRQMLKKAADTSDDPHMFIRFALEPAVKKLE